MFQCRAVVTRKTARGTDQSVQVGRGHHLERWASRLGRQTDKEERAISKADFVTLKKIQMGSKFFFVIIILFFLQIFTWFHKTPVRIGHIF